MSISNKITMEDFIALSLKLDEQLDEIKQLNQFRQHQQQQ